MRPKQFHRLLPLLRLQADGLLVAAGPQDPVIPQEEAGPPAVAGPQDPADLLIAADRQDLVILQEGAGPQDRGCLHVKAVSQECAFAC